MAVRPVSTPSRVSTVLLVCAAVAALYFAQEVLIPLVLALLLTFLLAPAVRYLERKGLGRIGSVLAVVAVAFALIFALGWVVANQVVEVAQNLPQYQDEIVRKVRAVRGHGSSLAEKIGRMGREIEKATNDAQPASQPTTATVARVATAVSPATMPAPDGTLLNPVYTVPLPSPGRRCGRWGSTWGWRWGRWGRGLWRSCS